MLVMRLAGFAPETDLVGTTTQRDASVTNAMSIELGHSKEVAHSRVTDTGLVVRRFNDDSAASASCNRRITSSHDSLT